MIGVMTGTAEALAAAATPAAPPPAPASNMNWLALASLALLVLVTSWLSLTYTRFATGVSAVWLANGLLSGALLLAPRQHWRWYFLVAAMAQVVSRTLRDDPWPYTLAIVTANMIECAIVAFWVRRGDRDLDSARSLPRVSRAALGSTLVACAVSGLVAAPIVAMRTSSPAVFAWLTWYGAHVLGLVIVATLVVCSFQRHVRMIPEQAIARLDYAGCLSLLLLACWVVFTQQHFPVLFLVFLPLLLLAWRHGLSGMVVGVTVVTLTSGIPATNGDGPFGLVSSTDPTIRLLFWQMFIASACILAYSSAVSLTRRQQLENSLVRSQARYRILADYSRDMIVRRAPGKRVYVSPASRPLLDYEPDELPPIEELLHPDDLPQVLAQFDDLFSRRADTTSLRFRARHRDGHYVWLEAVAQALDSQEGRQVVYTARDISQRIAAEQGQAAIQAQLQAITDHLPAMVARFDRDARYIYANSLSQAMVPQVDLIGKTLPELRGPKHWAEFAPMVDAVLRGESQEFDTWMTGPDGKRVELHAQFVPDRDAQGNVQGFYSLAFDITEAKNFERELERLARVDALTGLANRRRFEEELDAAVARAIRTGTALMVVSLDLDKFKQVNDTLGHAAGDEVLVEFGKRIRASVYNVDLVARLGGDEFVVLVQYTANTENGERIAKNILAAMQPPMHLSVGPVYAATSVGVGLQHPVTSAADLLALADRALYEAKARGRNTYSLQENRGQSSI
jgi:diguanylate cyclase (GGDEF)-like protein/PAS domain S-box-containing protein